MPNIFVLSTAVVVGITSGISIYLLWKTFRHMKNNSAARRRRQLHLRSVAVVTNSEEWQSCHEILKKDLSVTKVLGFDCEWVNKNGKSNPVAMLQLASSSGFCVLIRLPLLFSAGLPKSLQQLLADRSILKVGVSSLEDGRKLERDYGLECQGCLDLRNLAVRARVDLKKNGLKAMTSEILGIDLDKSIFLRMSDWEADVLTTDQINYAAQDALAGIYIFMELMKRKFSRKNNISDEEEIGNRTASMCQGLIDIKFKTKSNSKKTLKNSCEPGNDVSSHLRRTTNTRAYVPRKKPLYHNCQLLSPDGQLLCTCDIKKALWYLEKDLGVKILDEPLTILLNFEPSGRPLDENNYYLQEKKNVCVVCGKNESYIRKNVVPHEYRKHFPPVMKEHRSHDIVLMCTSCHLTSSAFDAQVKRRLSIKCSAEQTSARHLHSPELTKVKSAAKALKLNSRLEKIPQDRIQKLEKIVKDYFGVRDVDDDLLEHAVSLDTRLQNEDFSEHGRRVIEYAMENEGLVAFERMWREHFLDTMRPSYLPDLWSVDHYHQELIGMGIDMKDAVEI